MYAALFSKKLTGGGTMSDKQHKLITNLITY
jgi:hypothetical protein